MMTEKLPRQNTGNHPDPLADTVRRFYWKTRPNDFDNGEGLDEVCIDRLTGDVVVRYDLGDPANYDPDYGGWSHAEYLQRKGFDPDERIARSSENSPQT